MINNACMYVCICEEDLIKIQVQLRSVVGVTSEANIEMQANDNASYRKQRSVVGVTSEANIEMQANDNASYRKQR